LFAIFVLKNLLLGAVLSFYFYWVIVAGAIKRTSASDSAFCATSFSIIETVSLIFPVC